LIHADHLNTPRLVADATGTTVWRWDQAEPFGSNPADENPSALGAFDLPLRLPGQYYDKETNLHYNYFRDYDPSIGRYVESDPLGLWAGLNTYAYVEGNPLIYSDPDALIARPSNIEVPNTTSSGSSSSGSGSGAQICLAECALKYVAYLNGRPVGCFYSCIDGSTRFRLPNRYYGCPKSTN
jgi:RHS repeat-associated protein